jgi:putative hydrolase of the HAD superfamily
MQLCGIVSPGDIQKGLDILEEEQNDVTFFEGVQETLHTLKSRGFLLGIITDTTQPLYNKLSWFERAGIGDVWDAIICSNEMGISKPDARIYQAALRQLDILPEEAVFVGHKKTELDGAKAVGIGTIAFNQEENAVADVYIKKFPDLLHPSILSPTAVPMW